MGLVIAGREADGREAAGCDAAETDDGEAIGCETSSECDPDSQGELRRCVPETRRTRTCGSDGGSESGSGLTSGEGKTTSVTMAQETTKSAQRE